VPFLGIGPVRRDDPDIISLDVSREKNVEGVRCGSRKYQIARQVFVVRVCLDQLVATNRSQDCLARDESPRKAHVHVICPQDASASDAVLNESDRVVR